VDILPAHRSPLKGPLVRLTPAGRSSFEEFPKGRGPCVFPDFTRDSSFLLLIRSLPFSTIVESSLPLRSCFFEVSHSYEELRASLSLTLQHAVTSFFFSRMPLGSFCEALFPNVAILREGLYFFSSSFQNQVFVTPPALTCKTRLIALPFSRFIALSVSPCWEASLPPPPIPPVLGSRPRSQF